MKKKNIKIIKGVLAVGAALGAFGSVTAVFAFVYLSSNLPSVKEINNQSAAESTKIYDREDKIILYEIHGAQKRTTILFEKIPDSIKQATISIEDANFYKNPAFDWRGILRAVWVNVSRGGAFQGGSTITQQLAKNAFLSPERTIVRKIKELILASRLEKYYSKDEILNLYLNQVPYGSNVYGVDAAAQFYFSKDAEDLNLNESAMLAALTKAPTFYSPWGSNSAALVIRKNLVLQRMNELGYITKEQFDAAKNEKLKIASQSAGGIKAPHFSLYIQDYLNKKYGESFVQKAGLKVTTTLDWDLQQIGEQAVKEGVRRNAELYKGNNAALSAIDPKTGQILVMVGSADYFNTENEGNFNVVAQGLRQPGSAFKPLAYMTAFQEGFTPDTIIWDVPTEFNATGDPEKSYKPGNFDELSIGPVRMKNALAESRNVPAVKTLYLAGVEETIRNAEKFGITTLKDRSRFGLSLVLGGGDVVPLELTGVYGVFATEGIRHQLTPILKITDSKGNVLEEYRDSSERVVEAQYPRLINDILSDSDLRAPLYSSSLSLTQVPGYQVALKTGTTNNYVDAWTFGYTPNLVAGVWVGNNHREPLQKNGGSILAAVPIWNAFFSKAIQKYPPETFNKPEPVSSDIPMVRGELAQGEMHDVLYYLNRLEDPQFKNWEDGITEWLLTSTVDYAKFAAPAGTESIGFLALDVRTPKNGDTLGNNALTVDFLAKSEAPINTAQITLNGNIIDQRNGNLGLELNYRNSFFVNDLRTQNLLEIKITDSGGFSASKSFIIFR